MGAAEIKKIGIILLNLGGPDSIQAVRPFLYNLFSDRRIIRLGPSFLQKPLAYLISSLRAKKAEGMYGLIGGKSPILDITTAQAAALEEALNSLPAPAAHYPPLSFKVYVGMKYWHPMIEKTVGIMYKDGIRHILAISLYPHYSSATAGAAISSFEDAVKKIQVEYSCIPSWHDHPLYIDALADVIKKGMEAFSNNSALRTPRSGFVIPILYSAHSLPVSIVNSGDPYLQHIKATISEVENRIDAEWHLSFQSRSGPVKWLGPSTGETLKGLAAKGVRRLLVVPISFVSDHLETLYEIDILYKNQAQGLGIELKRAESLNAHPLLTEAFKEMIISRVKETGWTG